MKKLKYILFTLLILFLYSSLALAECNNEELIVEQEKASNIKITYKHLGEVTKEDGSTIYNEFLVTARNVEEGQYIHLSPLTNTNFITEDNEIKITLTTGKWEYNIYSSKCDSIVKTINVNLPTFNMYSIDPLCEGIDGDDFALCSKYLNYEVSRETFEKKINEYKKNHSVSDNIQIDKSNFNIKDIMIKVLDFISKNNLYIAGILLVILIILLIIIVNKKRKKRKILE